MDPATLALLGYIIPSSINAVSQGITNYNNRENVKLQNQMNIEQWQLENAFNDPSAQMARLRRAGLSPGLMYQNGVAGLTSAPSPEMQGARDIAPQMIGSLDFAGAQVADAQAENLRADAALKRAQLPEVEKRIEELDASIKERTQNVIESMSRVALNNQSVKESIARVESQALHDKFDKKKFVMELSALRKQLKMQDAEFDRFVQLTPKVILYQNYLNALTKSQGELTDKQKELVQHEMNLKDAEIAQIKGSLRAVGIELKDDGTLQLVPTGKLKFDEEHAEKMLFLHLQQVKFDMLEAMSHAEGHNNALPTTEAQHRNKGMKQVYDQTFK